ncbi:MAG: hypothetical protein ACI84C_000796 [Flavobacteriales bacterium]|jgi:uncharacterized protein (TIGR02757 family)
MMHITQELKGFLDLQVDRFNRPDFIEFDPISIPHQFDERADQEIIGFLVATVSWGNRKSILKSGKRMVELMDNAPFDFMSNHEQADLKQLLSFKHRTFNGDDFICFISSMRHLFDKYGSLEAAFYSHFRNEGDLMDTIERFREDFFSIPHLPRTQKHVSNPAKGSAAKRIHMFLRWMIRNDDREVDFGIWKKFSPSVLTCPLDVHSGKIARELGLLDRKQDDRKAAVELNEALRHMDNMDPVKYDFALFGLGEERRRIGG